MNQNDLGVNHQQLLVNVLSPILTNNAAIYARLSLFGFFFNDHVPVLSFQVFPSYTEKLCTDVWNLQGKIQNSLNLLIYFIELYSIKAIRICISLWMKNTW